MTKWRQEIVVKGWNKDIKKNIWSRLDKTNKLDEDYNSTFWHTLAIIIKILINPSIIST